MTEKELQDMSIQGRINMLIGIFHENEPEKSEK